jgi:hypothetical protein
MQVFQVIVFPLLILIGLGAALYFYLRERRTHQNQMQSLEWQKLQFDKNKATMSLRLAAYERLLLLCERVTIPNLLARFRTEGATVNDLRLAILIGIQQEFEHNVTQQIYVSENLWSIVKVARDNTAQIINIAAEKLDPKAESSALINELFKILGEQETDSLATAQAAIRQEAASLL